MDLGIARVGQRRHPCQPESALQVSPLCADAGRERLPEGRSERRPDRRHHEVAVLVGSGRAGHLQRPALGTVAVEVRAARFRRTPPKRHRRPPRPRRSRCRASTSPRSRASWPRAGSACWSAATSPPAMVADQQQPYNLRVPGGVQTIGNGGIRYDIKFMQIPPGRPDPRARRRLARPDSGSPRAGPAAARCGRPAVHAAGAERRAGRLRWRSPATVRSRRSCPPSARWPGSRRTRRHAGRARTLLGIVKPGEVRACGGCHGVNRDQAGGPPATNLPMALRDLLEWWRDHANDVFANGFD